MSLRHAPVAPAAASRLPRLELVLGAGARERVHRGGEPVVIWSRVVDQVAREDRGERTGE